MNPSLRSSLKSIIDLISTKELKEKNLEKYLEDLSVKMVENDVAYDLARSIASSIEVALAGVRVARLGAEMKGLVIKAAKEELSRELPMVNISYVEIVRSALSVKTPFIHMFVGVNGTGKTTTIAKVAYMLRNAGFKLLVVCADTFRAGAIEQFRVHAERIGVAHLEGYYGKDPASVAFDAAEMARKENLEVVLIDTAGRFHTRRGLMEELGKIKRVVRPDHITLVVDAMTGNDSWEQAKTFMKLIGYDSIIITKFDADIKGGAALSVSYVSKKPIIFVGTGQNDDDLETFSLKNYIDSLFSKV